MSLPTALQPGASLAGAQSIDWPSAERQSRFQAWLQELAPAHGLHTSSLRLASADASFRRYFRIDATRGSRIIMDAPPQQEDCRPFVTVAALMASAGLRVPQVLAWQEEHGFLLLSDLGARTMMEVLRPQDPHNGHGLYLQAIEQLILWQQSSRAGVLAPYDEPTLRRELELFPTWYLAAHRGVQVDADMRRTLDQAFACICAQNLAWPSVYVHRDFMPRNLILPDDPAAPTPARPGAAPPDLRLGVLDFQDALYGPVTYDIASLLRDAFLSWDEDFVLDITIRYWEQARAAGLPVGPDFGEFYRGVEWIGLQRHLKVAGIFARLTLRDGKPRYLADTPRFIAYIRATAGRYRELKPLLRLVERVEDVAPVTGYSFGPV